MQGVFSFLLFNWAPYPAFSCGQQQLDSTVPSKEENIEPLTSSEMKAGHTAREGLKRKYHAGLCQKVVG